MTLADELKSILLSSGASLVGYADLSRIDPGLRDDLPMGISIGVALNPDIIAGINNGPTMAYIGEYERANGLLDELGHIAVDLLKKQGHSAKWFAATSAGIDSRLSTRLPHKTVATRAGLGWIGKCALLVTKQYGSAIRITSVLTNAVLPTNDPVNKATCGKCTDCVEACPAQAATGENWRSDLHRDSFFDAFACEKTANELAWSKVGIRNTICGRCIVSCPFTQKYIKNSR
ncbi:4Fe-4S double cluster binding domain-containing protein [Chloroflexota bacterium]